MSPYWITALFTIFLRLCSPLWSFAEEVVLDTGVIKVICGRDGGGFLDEVYLDRNNDGNYADNERIVLRPEGQPGLLVSYTARTKGTPRKGVAVGLCRTGHC